MSKIIVCKNCQQKNRIQLKNQIYICGRCKNKLNLIIKENYHATNLEIINTWKKELEESFNPNLTKEKNLLERTKVIKSNILHTLNMAEKLASIANDKKIFDTSSNLLSFEKEIEKIKKDVVTIAVFGQMSSGKSSFLNSLVGEKLLTVSQERATTTISVVRHIDNFEGQKDGNIEIHYKSKNDILFNFRKAIDVIEKHFSNHFSSMNLLTIENILDNRADIIEKLSTIKPNSVDRRERKEVKANKKTIELIINNLNKNIKYLGTVSTQEVLEKDDLISSEKSVFIDNIIFYKSIPLLKNIELIDTPGLGSNSQLDTRKSEEFIAKADIVMILTDAKEPMQKESEEDILHILEDIEREEEDSSFFDKVFIIINKIDDSENNREEIKELLKESLEDAEITIKKNHILFISARYEYLKRCDKRVLNDFHINNKENIKENDLEHIERTIYNFSTAEATSKFLKKHIKTIDKIFDEVDRNFKENLRKLGEGIKVTESKIEKFSNNKEKIKDELEKTLSRMIKDEYRVLLAKAYNIIDDTLKVISTEDYFKTKAKEKDTFKNADSDKKSSSHYQKLAKSLIQKIINETNSDIAQKIQRDIFNNKQKNSLKEKLQTHTKRIQKKYENDYGVILNLNEITIGTIKINLTKNIDLEISLWKSFKLFINPLTWGSTNKYIDASAEKWKEYSKEEYERNIKEEIKKQTARVEKGVQKKITTAIYNIVTTIDKQLKQELVDKQNLINNKKETMQRKLKIQDSFLMLSEEFISKIKKQNQTLFQ